jgi:hypothetical protein
MPTPEPRLPGELSILVEAQQIKRQDRARLAAMEPAAAQAEVDAILVALAGSVADPAQLAWPGDLGDEAEEPPWMQNP